MVMGIIAKVRVSLTVTAAERIPVAPYMLSAVEPPRADCISDKVVERLLPAEVSPSVRAAVMGAMQRKSKHRLPSAEAFANVLAGGDADAYCDKGWWHGVLSKCCFKY